MLVWDLFLSPFAAVTWAAVLFCSLACSLIVTFIVSPPAAPSFLSSAASLAANTWFCFTFYFGGRPPPSLAGDSRLRLLLFLTCLAANVVFITYRAALVSKLAVEKETLPFNDWDSFMASDYKY